MTQIMPNIYIGNELDYHMIPQQDKWATLHCCKIPFHCAFAGYKGKLPHTHPDYMLCRINNEMALNLLDNDKFNADYVLFNKEMFIKAFAFLDEYRALGYKLLIHCNQGLSRAPTLGMLYTAMLGKYNYAGFDETVKQFKQIYPEYAPRANIYMTTQAIWNDIVIHTLPEKQAAG